MIIGAPKPPQPFGLQRLFAYVLIDKGTEKLVAIKAGTFPLVFQEKEKADLFKKEVEHTARVMGKEVRLVEFSDKKVIETINPGGLIWAKSMPSEPQS